MAPTFQWSPTRQQSESFEEWKKLVIGYLVSCKEGVNIRSIPGILEDTTGEPIPLSRIGLRTINHFIYAMCDSVEVRTLDGKFFVFIRECAVPENMKNIRQLVLGQAKDKSCRTKTGTIKRPTKSQSNYARPEALLEAAQHVLSRPANSYPNLNLPVASYSRNTKTPSFRRPVTHKHSLSGSSGHTQRASVPNARYSNPASRPLANARLPQRLPSASSRVATASTYSRGPIPTTSSNNSCANGSRVQQQPGVDRCPVTQSYSSLSLSIAKQIMKPTATSQSGPVGKNLQGRVNNVDKLSPENNFDYNSGSRVAEPAKEKGLSFKETSSATMYSTVKIAAKSNLSVTENVPILNNLAVQDKCKTQGPVHNVYVSNSVEPAKKEVPRHVTPVPSLHEAVTKPRPIVRNGFNNANEGSGINEVPKNCTIPSTNMKKKSSDVLLKAVCLDTENVLFQNSSICPIQQAFMKLDFLFSIFPKYRQGASVYSNCSLKSFLESLGSSPDAIRC